MPQLALPNPPATVDAPLRKSCLAVHPKLKPYKSTCWWSSP